MFSETTRTDCEWEPLPGPQTQVFETDAFETLYGGAAGGGKTSCAVGLAKLQGQHVLVLRRTFSELEDSVIQEAYRWYGDPAAYNSTKHVWQWGQQRIRFGYAERLKDVFQYQSAQFDTLLVDEITQWKDPRIYEYLLSRVRTTDPRQRCRVVAFTNPGNAGGAWVVHRWRAWLDPTYPDPAEPGELRYFRRDESGRDVECEPDHPDAVSRTFIPAQLRDNPYLGEDYAKQLRALPDPWRAQLLDGDWTAGTEDDPGQLIPTAWIQAAMAREFPEDLGPLSGVGIDVARGGQDKTVIQRRYGVVFPAPLVRPGRETPDGRAVHGLVISQGIPPNVPIGIDVLAVGSSPVDMLREAGYRVTPIDGAASAKDYRGEPYTDQAGILRFRNLRAAMYWTLRELLENEEVVLPDDPELLAELTAVTWEPTPTGIKLVSKNDIKAALGHSPDKADALVYALWQETAPVTAPPLAPSMV